MKRTVKILIFILSTITGSIYAGASILPYVVEETFNQQYNKTDRIVYFLLGREAKGKHTGEWTDFGGEREKGEGPFANAARECDEETTGIISQKYIYARAKKEHLPAIGNTYILNIEDLVGKNPNQLQRDAFIARLHNKRDQLIKAGILVEKDLFEWRRRKDVMHNTNKDLRNYFANKVKDNQTLKGLGKITPVVSPPVPQVQQIIQTPVYRRPVPPVHQVIKAPVIKPVVPQTRPQPSFTQQQIPAKVPTIGAGILPYIIQKDKKGHNEVYFLLRMNYKEAQLSTFGGQDKDTTKELKQIAAEQVDKLTHGVIPKDYLLNKINNSTPRVANTFIVNIQDLRNEKNKPYFTENATEKEQQEQIKNFDKAFVAKGFKPYCEWESRSFIKEDLNRYEYFEKHLVEILNNPE